MRFETEQEAADHFQDVDLERYLEEKDDDLIECGKLESGEIKNGRLVETGLETEPKAGKKVKIKLSDNQIVEGEIVEEIR